MRALMAANSVLFFIHHHRQCGQHGQALCSQGLQERGTGGWHQHGALTACRRAQALGLADAELAACEASTALQAADIHRVALEWALEAVPEAAARECGACHRSSWPAVGVAFAEATRQCP